VEFLRRAAIDEAIEAVLSGNLQRLAAPKLPSPLLDWGARPHLTVAIAGSVDARLKDGLAAIARSRHSMPIRLSSVGTFPGRSVSG
jgi:2'-5' RNA ligase